MMKLILSEGDMAPQIIIDLRCLKVLIKCFHGDRVF